MSRACLVSCVAKLPTFLCRLILLLSLFLQSGVTSHLLYAQDDAAETVEEPTTAVSDAGTSENQVQEKSVLWWLIETSGFIGLVLLLLSIYFVAKTVQSFLELRLQNAMPPELVSECDSLVKQKDYMGVYKRLKQDPSMYGAILAAGIAELPHGLAESRETMDRVCDAHVVDMEQQISMLAVLGSLGPMIGLLGTLKGMISSFGVIALSDTQLKASEVAGGISEALVLTFEGVGLSVPAIYFFAVFRNRVASISTTTLLAADEFVRNLYSNMRSKAPPPAGASPVGSAVPPRGAQAV